MNRSLPLLAGALLCAAGPARAADVAPWVVLPSAASPDDAQSAGTFRDLLVGELTSAGAPAPVAAGGMEACRDTACAQKAGAEVGASLVVQSTIARLGSKLVVSVSAVEADGSIRSSGRLSALSVEELDTLAARFATAIVSGKAPADTIALGTVTEKEAKAPLRRKGDAGPSLRVGGVLPINGYADLGGVGIDAGYWFEGSWFAIEPRVGVHMDVGDDRQDWWEVPAELSVVFLFGDGDIAPFVGGQMGARFLATTVSEKYEEGDFLVTTSERLVDHDGWGFSGGARLGVLFFRTYETRVALSAEYQGTLVDLGRVENPQSLGLGLSVIF
jgi:hypothetical protein